MERSFGLVDHLGGTTSEDYGACLTSRDTGEFDKLSRVSAMQNRQTITDLVFPNDNLLNQFAFSKLNEIGSIKCTDDLAACDQGEPM